MRAMFPVKGALVVGALAAIGASVCCAGPLVLLMLGIGGAWVVSLTALVKATTDAGFPSVVRK